MTIQSHLILAILALAAATQSRAQPIVIAVMSDAGDQQSSMMTVVQGSVFSILTAAGSAPAGPADTLRAAGFPLARELGGTSVRITVDETTVDAWVLSTEARRVRALLPSATPEGEGTLTISFDDQTSVPQQIRVVRREFGIYKRSFLEGSSQAGGIQTISSSGVTLNTLTDSARPGQIAILWGTGLGPVAGDEAGGPLPTSFSLTDIEVLVGGLPARVLWAGRSGCCAGLDQVIFETPAGIEGCSVPVAVRFRDTAGLSNHAPMSIMSAGGACFDPHGLPRPVLDKLAKHGSITYGLVSNHVQRPYGNRGNAVFLRGSAGLTAPLGTCTDYNGDFVRFGLFPRLDAGGALSFSAEQGTVQWMRDSSGGYGGALLDPGEYILDNSRAGRDLGPFRVAVTVKASGFVWTNEGIVNRLRRDQAIPITWTVPDAGEAIIRIEIFLGALYGDGSTFVCYERAAKRSFTIPPYVWTPRTRGGVNAYIDVSFATTQPLALPGVDFAEFVYKERIMKNNFEF